MQKKIATATDQVFQQQESYNSIIRSNTEQFNAERDIFHKFFTKPQVLLREMRALEEQNKPKIVPAQRSPRKTPKQKRNVQGSLKTQAEARA